MKKILKISLFIVFVLIVWKIGTVLFGDRELDFSGEKIIKINDNGLQFLTVAKAATVGELMEQEGIALGEQDVVSPSVEAKLMPGTSVTIDRTTSVVILADGKENQHQTFGVTVGGALSEAGVTLSHLDKVSPGKDEPVEKDLQIVVTRINVEQVTETEPIEFETVEKQDKKLKWRKKKIEQEGAEGKKEVKYEVTYKNGEQVSKERLSSSVVEKPTDEIVRIGTKVEVGKTKTGIASWYAHTGTMACASRMFGDGTWLRVTNRENGKQIFVVVNDYGPQRGTGKMIDLDAVAFKKLAPLGAGVIDVKVEEILE